MNKQAFSKNIILLYPKPDKSLESCGSLRYNQIVYITDEKEDWYYISGLGWSNQKMFFEIISDIDDEIIDTNINYGRLKHESMILKSIPNDKSDISAVVFKGENLKVTQRMANWSNINNLGWSSFIAIPKAKDNSTTVVDDSTTNEDGTKKDEASFELSKDYGYTNDEIKDEKDAANILLNSETSMFGMPYQYMSSVDQRITGTRYGSKFASKILQNMPMFLVTPGKPKFMKGYSGADKDNVLKSLADNDKSLLDSILNKSDETKNGKYYSLEFAYAEYYERVNPMCHNMARLCELQNVIYRGSNIMDYNWANNQDEKFAGFISSKESVAFYIDSETQISESFTNSTGQSALAGSINQLSDLSRELKFLIGGETADTIDRSRDKTNYEATLADFNKVTSKFSSILPSSLISRLSEGVATVTSGGKLLFPEIYNDSDFSKSYDISIKLRTPDCDKLSIYLNILVPLAHLIGLVAPAQLNANGYSSPFLIRAYYKGFFNVDMGIITSMSISKGDKGSWTLDGLPTKIDVNIQLKDLYNIFALSSEKHAFDILNNTAELDYLANLCGINVNKVDIGRSIDTYYYNMKGSIVNKITMNHFMGVQQHISNLTKSIFGR